MSLQELERRYDAVNAAYTRILQGGGVSFYIDQLASVLTPQEMQELQAFNGDQLRVRKYLWDLLVDMTEDS